MPERPEPSAGRPSGEPDSGGASNYAGMGMQFVLSILLFLWLGYWLDGKLGTSPWLLIVGTFLGAGAGFYSMVRRVNSDEKEARARKGKA